MAEYREFPTTDFLFGVNCFARELHQSSMTFPKNGRMQRAKCGKLTSVVAEVFTTRNSVRERSLAEIRRLPLLCARPAGFPKSPRDCTTGSLEDSRDWRGPCAG